MVTIFDALLLDAPLAKGTRGPKTTVHPDSPIWQSNKKLAARENARVMRQRGRNNSEASMLGNRAGDKNLLDHTTASRPVEIHDEL
jgi:hypothetical protein